MKRIKITVLAVLAVIALLSFEANSYDKLKFKGIIKNSALINMVDVSICGKKIFAVDSKAKALFIFDESGKLLKKANSGLKSPSAAACSDSKIYVSDSKKSDINVFDLNGKFLWSFGSKGSLPGQLNAPMGAAVGGGRVYVANSGNKRIDVYNSDGIFIYGFPALKTDGADKISPVKISIDKALNIYVTDKKGKVIIKYDLSGKALKEFNIKNDGVTVDNFGFMYVINARKGKVKELSPDGEVIGTFGTRGKGRTEFKRLSGIACDWQGNIYLADAGNKKIVSIHLENKLKTKELQSRPLSAMFNLKGPSKKLIYKTDAFFVLNDESIIASLPEEKKIVLINKKGKKTFAREGREQGQVRKPLGFTVDKKGRVYIADTGNNRIQIFKKNGSFVNMFGEKGSDEGKFNSPQNLTINKEGRVYIADTRNKRIQAFNSDGFFLFSFGPEMGNLILKRPIDIKCDEDGNVYILDSELKKVIKTDASGKLLKVWDDSGNLDEPAALAYDNKGYFYILDRGVSSVKIFDKDGNFVTGFFSKGNSDRELGEPAYMAFSNDKLYISDTRKSSLVSFVIKYTPPTPASPKILMKKKAVKLVSLAAKNGWIKEYAVYRKIGEDKFAKLGILKKGEYSDAKLSGGGTYYYALSAVSKAGDESALSKAAEIYIKGAKSFKKVLEGKNAASKNISPVEIEPVDLGYIFSSNYKYYMKNPIGKIALKNNTDKTFDNVKISFYLKDFMDFPTDKVIDEIKPGEKVEVALRGTLNNKILNITEDTPIQAQLIATYYDDGSEKKFTLNQPLKVLSKNAIVWDNTKRLANFITPKDTPVFSFSRFALRMKEKLAKKADMVDENLFKAILIWESLGKYGLGYLQDPVNPYSQIKSSGAASLDTVQFPRNTLKVKSGDCDDLTALFASLLEASGIHTAIMDYPTHIAIMFDTGKTNVWEIGLPEDYMIKRENTYWIGLETTMIGKNIIDAIKHEALMFRQNEKEVKIVDVRSAWADFEPVTLPETEWNSYPDVKKVEKSVGKNIDDIKKLRYDYFSKNYKNILREKPDDKEALINLGILNAEYEKYSKAKKYFTKLLDKNPADASALNNMGNIAFLEKHYAKAKDYYFKASKIDGYDGNIWLNLARVSVKLGKKEDIKAFADKAVKLDASLKQTASKLIKE